VNTGGWLVLTATFSILLLVVQRTERKRRMVTAVIMAFVALVVWRYALYRMSNDCDIVFTQVCSFNWVRQRMAPIATRTVNWSIVAALVFSVVFWVFIGRSNPPGSSDSIEVLGMND
jgi:ABC-type uncharacterized transport system permease subunit